MTAAPAIDLRQPGRRTIEEPGHTTPHGGNRHLRGRKGCREGDRDRYRDLTSPHSSHPETCTASRLAQYGGIAGHDSMIQA